MAKQTANSGLIAKLGDKLRKAHENHKADDVKYDANGGLPAGIENGIAQLKTCKFGQYEKGDNKGEFYLMMTGIIVEPKAHEGVPVQGLRTSIMEPMCDTPTRSRKSVDDHVAFVYNEFKKLGADTADADPDNLEELAAAVQEAAPYFRFRTWKGSVATSGQYAGKESRTQEVWNGIVIGYEQEVSGEVEDETEEAAKPAPAKKPATPPPAPQAAPSAGPAKKAGDPR